MKKSKFKYIDNTAEKNGFNYDITRRELKAKYEIAYQLKRIADILENKQ